MLKTILNLLSWTFFIQNASLKGIRMSGGYTIKKGQFPFFAHISNADGSTVCGATLIHPKWIITAAHCFTYVSTEFERFQLNDVHFDVYMGTVEAFDTDATENTVEYVVIHPKYVLEFINDDPLQNEKRLEFDVALARLCEEYKSTKYIQPIKLPQRRALDDDSTGRCKTGIIIGIGQTTDYGQLSTHAKYTTINGLNRSQLSSPKTKPCTNTIFYAETVKKDKKKKVLPGDSGGPFVCQFVKKAGRKEHVLFGIISSGYNNTVNKTYVSVFESVEKHVDFIMKHIKGVNVYEKKRGSKVSKDSLGVGVMAKTDRRCLGVGFVFLILLSINR